MTIKAVAMSRPVQAQEWAMRQASAIVEKHLPDMPLEKQWEISADIAEALTQTRMIFEPQTNLIPDPNSASGFRVAPPKRS